MLFRQMLKSKVVLEQGYDFISLKFKTEENERYPYLVRVPVEMRAFQKILHQLFFYCMLLMDL